MRAWILVFAVILASTANAEITGPTTSTTGSYVLTWTGPTDSFLVEYDNTNGGWAHIWTDPTVPVTRPDGTYHYSTLTCTFLPFFELYCVAHAVHTVHVVIGGPPGIQYPQTPAEQAEYEYEVRSGDFTGNGRTDLLVDRLTAGPMDGSQQTFILHQNMDGSLTAIAPNASQLSHARTFPLAPNVNFVPVDMNADGYVDHTLQNLSLIMGSSVTDEYIIFAPGTTLDKTRPSGIRAIDNEVKAFMDDIGRWFNKATHFTDNMQVTERPIYGIGFHCGVIWHYDEAGFQPSYLCTIGFELVDWEQVVFGINLDALSASNEIQKIFQDLVDDDLVDGDLWQLSQIIKAVFGVQAFGFDDNGVRHPTNHGGDSPLEERWSAFGTMVETWGRAMIASATVLTNRWHDFSVETVICQQAEPGCTLANIACWLRRYPAPFRNDSDHAAQIINGQQYLLKGIWGEAWPNNVRSFRGDATSPPLNSPLPQDAVANVTLPGHVFHRSSNPEPPECPKPVPGDWQTGPWNYCDQTYRQPATLPTSEIAIRTRGFGMNRKAHLNQIAGPRIFRSLDNKMKGAFSAAGGDCFAP